MAELFQGFQRGVTLTWEFLTKAEGMFSPEMNSRKRKPLYHLEIVSWACKQEWKGLYLQMWQFLWGLFLCLFFFFCFIEDRVVRKAKAVLIAEQSVQGYRIIQVSIFHPKRFFCWLISKPLRENRYNKYNCSRHFQRKRFIWCSLRWWHWPEKTECHLDLL